ncbi:hypothetical protein EHQ12_00855 [Leptospira gomenensis]|uniref:Uncharacterized protein n=1 Tax=Leptospira gomenensis TaxID=2484974 RepID=A0A5F1Y6R0_9LEPT|nr:hypothetical protein [Leptospira gomenensis]TGK29011.1 hypothetical protein EHQ17_16780 [Leptospira gomenensis]TGK44978.1 hypothetical protein EHQ12_00855 [Leptospira gomenensis]TGK51885.1 hypothetical protein EHQ07_01750 [Leptospira gomenensis]TGK67307.1 hypothetical protein EHQ13_02320 [Leptospira gomenensis]
MSLKSFQSVFAILFLVSVSVSVSAQSAPSKDEVKGSELASAAADPKYQGDYLEEFHYARTLDSLKERVKNDIHALATVTKNFGSSVQGSNEELNSIWKQYNDALHYYYRRQYVVAGRKMRETTETMDKLYNKFSDQYNKRTDQLLGECADTIVGIEQSQGTQVNNSAARSREISANHHKLQIAYYQMIQADRMRRDSRYKDSLIHFRLAKEYGISILSKLKSDEESKNIREKYKVDLSDNRNMVFAEGGENKDPQKK